MQKFVVCIIGVHFSIFVREKNPFGHKSSKLILKSTNFGFLCSVQDIKNYRSFDTSDLKHL